jgi:hypothetical protein
MTNDILQSDIDLARKLLDANRPADEIVVALGYRGINGNRAAQLVADLQAGKAVEPDRPIYVNLPSPSQQPSRKITPPELAAEPPQASWGRQKKSNAFPWFTIIALAAAAVCVVAFVLLTRKSRTNDSVNSASDQPTTDSRRSKHGSSVPDAKAITLEVEPKGLRLSGNSLTRENFLPAVFKILGPPARTNQVEKADQVIYAYDTCGLLVYAPRNEGHYSIVLDFDASDGAAGTKNAFIGTFKINNQVVRPHTDAASLGSIKELGLQSPKSDSGIYHAQYGTLDLVFGYLKSPDRLSLIEIDFK